MNEQSGVLAFPLAIVCHDAGAANHVVAWMKSGLLSGDCRVVMEGPARKIWATNGFNETILYPSLTDALCDVGCLVSGTGWGSNLEHDARAFARKRSLPSIAVIDHWVNYTSRFERQGERLLPDELWVTDTYAYAMAERELPDVPVCLMQNAYISGLLRDISAVPMPPNPPESRILYVLEPARSDWGRQGLSGEFQALDYFIANIAVLGLGSDPEIVLRPHPSDSSGKYDQWIAAHPELRVRVDNSSDLASAIAYAQCVVGCQTYAMVIASEAGKKVVSSLPPWAPPCSLPQKNILQLSKLII
jgi:hypothetical protein